MGFYEKNKNKTITQQKNSYTHTTYYIFIPYCTYYTYLLVNHITVLDMHDAVNNVNFYIVIVN